MRGLVTGSSGHLGEALVGALSGEGVDVVGLDIVASAHTSILGSIIDRGVVRASLEGVDVVIHTATLHKPHVGTHTRQDFVDTNVSGTLNLLEEAADAGVGSFVYTSTTSTFGQALSPPPGDPAAWITQNVAPVRKNSYGATKTAAEDLCELVARDRGLPCVILRTSRFFPEADDRDDIRRAYEDLRSRSTSCCTAGSISKTSWPLTASPSGGHPSLASAATSSAPPRRSTPRTFQAYGTMLRVSCGSCSPPTSRFTKPLGWKMFPTIERVYVNARARRELGWSPRYDFGHALDHLVAGKDPRSPRAVAVGAKGYHAVTTGVYTTR